jgi:hypothetical protein
MFAIETSNMGRAHSSMAAESARSGRSFIVRSGNGEWGMGNGEAGQKIACVVLFRSVTKVRARVGRAGGNAATFSTSKIVPVAVVRLTTSLM